MTVAQGMTSPGLKGQGTPPTHISLHWKEEAHEQLVQQKDLGSWDHQVGGGVRDQKCQVTPNADTNMGKSFFFTFFFIKVQ